MQFSSRVEKRHLYWVFTRARMKTRTKRDERTRLNLFVTETAICDI